MQPALVDNQRRRGLVAYFVLTYAISWAIEIPIALSLRGIIPITIPMPIHYLASFGPFCAALIVAAVIEGAPGIRSLFSGLGKWRVGVGYASFAVLVPIALFAVAVVATRLMRGAWPDLGLLADVDYLPGIGIVPALILWLLTFGFGEELGWRGYALPRLQASRSAYASALLLRVIWSGWHLPAFFYRDTYMAMGLLLGIPMLVFSVCVASVIITWLYNGTRGSLLMVALFHALFDFFSVSEAGGESAPIIMSAVLVFWAVRVIKLHGAANLAPVAKHAV